LYPGRRPRAKKCHCIRGTVRLLGTLDDRIRHPPPGPALQDVLLPETPQPAALGKSGGKSEQAMIEEGVTTLHPMGHRHPIALTGEQVTGEQYPNLQVGRALEVAPA